MAVFMNFQVPLRHPETPLQALSYMPYRKERPLSKEQEFEEMIELLKKQLDPYRKTNLDYYLKIIGEVEKMIRKYRNPNEEH